MKRQIFTFLLIFISNFVYAQEGKNWGDWQTTKCFKGIQFRTRPMGTEPGKYGYSRYIQFRNNYNTRVAFGYTIKGFQKEHDEYIDIHGSQYRTELKANSTDDGLMWFSSTNANGQYISLGYLRFLGTNEVDASKTFEGCDDRSALLCNSCRYKPTYWCSNYDKSKEKRKEPVNTTSNSLAKKKQIVNQIINNLKTNIIWYPSYKGWSSLEGNVREIDFSYYNSNIKVSLSYNSIDNRIVTNDNYIIPFESLNRIMITESFVNNKNLYVMRITG